MQDTNACPMAHATVIASESASKDKGLHKNQCKIVLIVGGFGAVSYRQQSAMMAQHEGQVSHGQKPG